MAQWLEYCLETKADELDALTAVLTGRGLTGLVIEDEADFLRFLEENRQYWDYVDEALAQQVKDRLGVREVHIGYTGPVIGAHSGPGTLALFFLGVVR